MFFAPSKSRLRAKIQIIDVSKTSEHIQIKINMPNPSQEPPTSSKAPNEDIKDMGVLSTVKFKINMSNPSQKHPALAKAQNQDLKDMDVLFTFKIKIESQHLEHW